MPETELVRALQDLTPEPPRSLRPDDIARRARHRRGVRVAAVTVPVLAAGVAAAVLHSGGSPSPTVVGQGEPTPTVEPTVAGTTGPHPQEPYVDMHSDGAPGPLTGGTADMDGDGRPDRVLVRSTNGAVSVELADGRTLHAELPGGGGSSERLQALPDLFGTETRQILIYSSAAGCCGYAPTDSRSWVLTIVDGELAVVRDPGGQPLQLYFSAGRGGVYAGITCDASAHSLLREEVVPGDSRHTTTITLSGATANEVSDTPTSYPLQAPKDYEVARACEGLQSGGRAS